MDFVIIANAWSAGHDNPTSKHQIARELARQGHRVLWVEGAGMRRPTLASGADRSRIARKIRASLKGAVSADAKGVLVLAPLLIPLPRYKLIRIVNGWIFAAAARRWSRILGFERPILINYVPVLSEAMRFWSSHTHHDAPRKETVVYHCVDRWDRFDMYDSRMMEEVHEDCCRYADLVIASSRDLYDHCLKMHDNVHLVTHGVNRDHFASALGNLPKPADLPPGPIAGFFGLLSEWVDQELLVQLARELPELSVVLIGSADVGVEALKREANIHILGPRPFSDLPAYVAHFDVGLIPFKVTELTRAVNPIKLREMLAAGCPVVSTALPEVEAFTWCPFVSVGHSKDKFFGLVREVLENRPSSEKRIGISCSMAAEKWESKAAEILSLVRQFENVNA